MKRMVLLWVLTACSGAGDPTLEEAAEIHNEASAIGQEVQARLSRLDSLVKAGAVVSESRKKEISALTSDLRQWEDNLFEVPGYEHKHKEDGHHHHHEKSPDLPADKVLDIQKEIHRTIVSLRGRLVELELFEDQRNTHPR